MNNKRDLEDHEEAMGENQHHEGNSPPEGTVATLQFPIQQEKGISPMKNISPSMLPHFMENQQRMRMNFFLNLTSSVATTITPPMHIS